MAKSTKTEKYIEGIGRRKTSTARVRIYPDSKGKKVEVNDKDLKEYFSKPKHQKDVVAPFEIVGEEFKITAKTEGGGLSGQADAIRLGLSRALVKYNEEWKNKLKPYKFLTRDSRMKERKKPGLKGARRAKQWRKR